MDYFPVALRLQGKPCLVVGGGKVAERKVCDLLASSCQLTVWAPQLTDDLLEKARRGDFRYLSTEFSHVSQLGGYFVVVAATDNSELNHAIAKACDDQGQFCNNVSDVRSGNTLLPALVRRGSLTVAISCDGKSPTLTRMIKHQLEAFLPQRYGVLAELMGQWRKKVKDALAAAEQRRFWNRFLMDSQAAVTLGNLEAAEKQVGRLLASPAPMTGSVALIGAGPGDPELLTLKALRLMQVADICLYDRLVSDEIMALLPDSCERRYVGKRQADHAVPQDELNVLMADLAEAGHTIVRLKGGDPFIFGRGGEELETLVSRGIDFTVVPGITAASGCASYAGIPLTHRDYAQSVRFITGHLKNNQVNLPWPELAKSDQTLVFYMGLSGLAQICRALIDSGRSPLTPAAIVEKGTTPQQAIYRGTLESLPDLAVSAGARAPTLLIIGEVVQLQERLNWFRPVTQ